MHMLFDSLKLQHKFTPRSIMRKALRVKNSLQDYTVGVCLDEETKLFHTYQCSTRSEKGLHKEKVPLGILTKNYVDCLKCNPYLSMLGSEFHEIQALLVLALANQKYYEALKTDKFTSSIIITFYRSFAAYMPDENGSLPHQSNTIFTEWFEELRRETYELYRKPLTHKNINFLSYVCNLYTQNFSEETIHTLSKDMKPVFEKEKYSLIYSSMMQDLQKINDATRGKSDASHVFFTRLFEVLSYKEKQSLNSIQSVLNIKKFALLKLMKDLKHSPETMLMQVPTYVNLILLDDSGFHKFLQRFRTFELEEKLTLEELELITVIFEPKPANYIHGVDSHENTNNNLKHCVTVAKNLS